MTRRAARAPTRPDQPNTAPDEFNPLVPSRFHSGKISDRRAAKIQQSKNRNLENPKSPKTKKIKIPKFQKIDRE
jgi:hypothetical protein